MFELIVHINPKRSSDKDEFSFHLSKMREVCPKEPGCISWNAFRGTEKSASFFIIENWESKENWEAHLQLPTFKEHCENGLVPLMERDVYFVERIN
jgi:quinol monooxygenase YgiN